MELKIIILVIGLFFDFAASTVNNTQVELSRAWKKDVGWLVTCSWTLLPNDTLQSVRLFNNGDQFMIYLPKTDGEKRSEIFRPLQDVMHVECLETEARGVTGTCVVTLELYKPQKSDIIFRCEVSGERPKFLVDRKKIVISPYVPPTDTKITRTSLDEQTGRVELNCTSSGVPAPTLVWTIGDQKVPHDFTSSNYWNVSSKLWHVWSQMSYTPSSDQPGATCTPETSRGRELETGPSAHYNSASRMTEIGTLLITLLLLLR